MTKGKNSVLAIGELNIDLILNHIEGYPTVGKEILAKKMILALGSSTAIFAANLHSLSTPVSFLGKVGKDHFGAFVKESLEAKGVDTSLLIEDENLATGATVVLNYKEDRANVTYPGAMSDLTINDITPEKLRHASHIHFSSLFLQNGIRHDVGKMFKMAKENGLTTSLDTQWDPDETWDFDFEEILPWVDVFMPNEKELLYLAKVQTIESALQKFGRVANNIAVKCGNKGSVLYKKSGEIIEKPSYLNNNVIDAIGAGDSFNAGFISKFVKGCSLSECQDFGNLMGAINTTSAGGTSAFASKKQIEEVAKERFNVEIKW